jgi:hypothetical protein
MAPSRSSSADTASRLPGAGDRSEVRHPARRLEPQPADFERDVALRASEGLVGQVGDRLRDGPNDRDGVRRSCAPRSASARNHAIRSIAPSSAGATPPSTSSRIALRTLRTRLGPLRTCAAPASASCAVHSIASRASIGTGDSWTSATPQSRPRIPPRSGPDPIGETRSCARRVAEARTYFDAGSSMRNASVMAMQ